jgi:peptidoglycan/xylan/chitin deacetylase (PgdA/CDA1 family)
MIVKNAAYKYKNRYIKILVIILLLFPFLLSKSQGSFRQKQITIIFRYDDYSSLSSTEFELKLLSLLKKYNLSFTFGVIPYVCAGDIKNPSPQKLVPLTKEKINILKRALKDGLIEVAQHGYSHQTISTLGNSWTEFSGLEYERQMQKIRRGKNLLERTLDVQVTTFIPPWNSYDLNTIRALERLGFKAISASSGISEKSSKLKFIPVTIEDISKLKEAVNSARRSSDPHPLIVVMIHDYNFQKFGEAKGKFTYQDLDELLNWIASQKDVEVRSIGETAELMGDLDVKRFRNYSYVCFLNKLLPLSLGELNRVYFYPSLGVLREMEIKRWLIIISFYLTILVISAIFAFFLGNFVNSKSETLAFAVRYGVLILLGVILIYIFHDLDIHFGGAIVVISLFGACIGVWGFFFKQRKGTKVFLGGK